MIAPLIFLICGLIVHAEDNDEATIQRWGRGRRWGPRGSLGFGAPFWGYNDWGWEQPWSGRNSWNPYGSLGEVYPWLALSQQPQGSQQFPEMPSSMPGKNMRQIGQENMKQQRMMNEMQRMMGEGIQQEQQQQRIIQQQQIIQQHQAPGGGKADQRIIQVKGNIN